jgi:DNA-directed RNA polymerase subunit RPC12/RpoP
MRRRWLSIFQRYAECPKCGTRTLSRIHSRDRVDKISRNPLRRLLGLFGASLYHCIYCRYQFRDWRKRESDQKANPTLNLR